MIDTTKVDNITFEDIDFNDYPKFCDVYIGSADYSGIPMTEDELNELNEDSQFVNESLFDFLH